MTKQCFYCSYPNKDDATRCINCGMQLNKYWDKSGSRPELIDDWDKYNNNYPLKRKKF